jgi:hypothetical protein
MIGGYISLIHVPFLDPAARRAHYSKTPRPVLVDTWASQFFSFQTVSISNAVERRVTLRAGRCRDRCADALRLVGTLGTFHM